jgi:hypothetical protein
MLSSSAPDRYIRPVITFVIAASGLKYVGVGTTALGWILCGALLAAAATWLVYIRPRQSAASEAVAKATSAEMRAGEPTPSAEPAAAEPLAVAGAEPAPGESLLGRYSA